MVDCLESSVNSPRRYSAVVVASLWTWCCWHCRTGPIKEESFNRYQGSDGADKSSLWHLTPNHVCQLHSTKLYSKDLTMHTNDDSPVSDTEPMYSASVWNSRKPRFFAVYMWDATIQPTKQEEYQRLIQLKGWLDWSVLRECRCWGRDFYVYFLLLT